MSKDVKAKNRRGLFRVVSTALVLPFAVYILAVLAQPMFFADRFGLSSKIGTVDVSGKSAIEARQLLEQKWDSYRTRQVTVSNEGLPVASLVSDLKADETVNEALLSEQVDYLGFSKIMPQSHRVHMTYNDDAIRKFLLAEYDRQAMAPVDAKIVSLANGEIRSERVGQRLALGESREMIQDQLAQFAGEIGVSVVPVQPELSADLARSVIDLADASLSRPVEISIDGDNREISSTTLKSWLKITPITPTTLVSNDPFRFVGKGEYEYLDPNQVYLFVNKLADGIDVKAKNASLTVADGKVVVSQAEVFGKQVDRKQAQADIQESVKGDHNVTVAVSIQKPDVRTDNLDELGIKELISTGQTDAAGSPVNRIHNYTNGASKFNGVLIKPGEVFSFNKALGPVDASTGYLPELVILADKTVPEYGGGLCQVSSTAFRAALNAGLPINERHWHAYPVGYYKPYGVDATIYLPTPDLRFTNDTSHYILIQTRIVGTKLYFDFYGTKKPVTIKFSGNPDATGAVDRVEDITPTITDQGLRGPKSFTATFYRHIYDATGKLTDNDKFTSKYDTPDKYPH